MASELNFDWLRKIEPGYHKNSTGRSFCHCQKLGGSCLEALERGETIMLTRFQIAFRGVPWKRVYRWRLHCYLNHFVPMFEQWAITKAEEYRELINWFALNPEMMDMRGRYFRPPKAPKKMGRLKLELTSEQRAARTKLLMRLARLRQRLGEVSQVYSKDLNKMFESQDSINERIREVAPLLIDCGGLPPRWKKYLEGGE